MERHPAAARSNKRSSSTSGNQIAVQFDKTGTGDAAAADLSHRYLWGQAVDQLLADEQTDDLQTPGDVLWTLTDHLNTVRDLATYDAQNDETTIANHRTFHAYGAVTAETNAAVDCLFAFTGRLYDADTDSQNNLNRWYDAAVGRWMSEDPAGYNGGINLYEYCGDDPLTRTDPSGLDCESDFRANTDACNDMAIRCNRTCWNIKPPWPVRYHSWAHRAYCESTCQTAYMACYAGAEVIYAACKAKEVLDAMPCLP